MPGKAPADGYEEQSIEDLAEFSPRGAENRPCSRDQALPRLVKQAAPSSTRRRRSARAAGGVARAGGWHPIRAGAHSLSEDAELSRDGIARVSALISHVEADDVRAGG